MLLKNSDQINVVRISNVKQNDASLRVSISSTLNGFEFSPRGISPSSLLMIRELKDPMPGHFLPGSGNPEWAQKLRDSITDISRKASRPVSGIIPYNASAVLFADDAELLACLLLDASRGMAVERWWWKLLIKNNPGIKTGGLKGIMQISAVNLPAALFRIYEWDKLSSVFSAFTPQDSEAVFSEVGREYGITESQIRRFIVEMRKIEAGKKWRDDPQGEVKQGGSSGQDFSEIRDYLKSIFIQDRSGLDRIFSIHGKEKLSLFALCLVIGHRPSLAQTQVLVPGLLEFISEFPNIDAKYALQEERIRETDPMQIEDIKKEDNSSLIPEYGHEINLNTHDIEKEKHTQVIENKTKIITKFDFKSIGKSGADPRSADDGTEPLMKTVLSIKDVPAGLHEDTQECYAIGTELQTKASNESKNNSGMPDLIADDTSDETESGLPPEIEVMDKAKQIGSSSIFNDNGIKTQLCGVFYLINLMRELDLPKCFEEDFGLSSRVGAWGTLELLARAIIGNDEKFGKDPLWDILAGLDGRKDGAFVGDQMMEDGICKMPQLWFEKKKQKMDAGSYFDDQVPVEGIEEKLPGISPRLFRLMSHIMPFIRWYLRIALDPGAKKEKPEKDMLICNGRLYITSTHIDIMMKLDDISIPVRMAGLDIDPGWAADFGRIVKFHFD